MACQTGAATLWITLQLIHRHGRRAWPGPFAAPQPGRMTQILPPSDGLPPDPFDQQPGADQVPIVRADSPAGVLRLVPHLLGFVPEASLVVIGVAPPHDRIRVTLRYDLPDPPEAGLVADIIAHAVAVLSKQQLTAAVAIGYGPEALVTPLAAELRDAAWQAEIDVLEFLRVQDGRYWSYVCGNEDCCPAAGVPFEADADRWPMPPWPASARCWPAAPTWPPASRRCAASPPSPCARPPAGPSGT